MVAFGVVWKDKVVRRRLPFEGKVQEFSFERFEVCQSAIILQMNKIKKERRKKKRVHHTYSHDPL